MLITASRVVGAFSLLLLVPLSGIFYLVYAWCIASDILDGYIARKTRTTSNFGAFLDSAADLNLIAILLVIFLPLLNWDLWMLVLVGIVIFTRAVALSIGFVKYRTLTLLHTYANKGAGLVLASFPILYGLSGLAITISILFTAAFLSAFEELIITIRSKTLDRNITSMLA
ncbi:MAG: CDP-alcohol phosphatidyltransferase family protein [Defluviitaleaceae bacterium]|nr:CDP-alcohol phosphatidyltransferase family protein [Defluviitaleaceae bacterium]